MKKEYNAPKAEITKFEDKDIICTSGCKKSEDVPKGQWDDSMLL